MERKTEYDQPLRDLRILVVEDEFLISVMIEETLREAGAEIVTAATLPAALKEANDEGPLSAALLDVRLGRQTTEAVADVLAARSVPFIFYSGQSLPDAMSRKYPSAKVLAKPVKQSTFVDAIIGMIRH